MPLAIATTNADSESEDDDYVPPAHEQGKTLFFDLFYDGSCWTMTDSESDTEKSLESSHTAPTTVEDLEEKKRYIQAISLILSANYSSLDL